MANILKKIKGNKKPADDDATIPADTRISKKMPIQTSPLSEDKVAHIIDNGNCCQPAQLLIGSGQSNGMQRGHNEDTLFTLSTVVADGTRDLALGICIVADGMGGHKNGAIASGVAARVVASHLVKKVYTRFLDLHQEPFTDSLQEIMENAIVETHKSVLRYAPGGGTTFTCALIIGEQVTIGHVGDSRAYFLQSDGRFQKITKDHSLVQRMVELDEITELEASTHPQRNVLLKAIGQTERVFPDIQTYPLPRSGRILLCSDGLWGVVPESEILELIKSDDDPVIICQKLISNANAHGGPDNISAILVKCFG
ncbi:MAG: PP2C family protein-serine/threonine phosphatase [Anaerolineaceae bacterium]